MIPVKLTTPANTSSPALTFLGNVSPVKLEVSKVLSPFNRALTFLVVSCPCALVISIPLGLYAGLGKASKNS